MEFFGWNESKKADSTGKLDTTDIAEKRSAQKKVAKK